MENVKENEHITKLYDNYYTSINEITCNIIKSYYSRYKYLEKQTLYLSLNEPPKFFKNKYKKWIRENIEIENEKKEILNKIKTEYKNI